MNKLNMLAPMGKASYGVVGYNVLRILKERDWDVALFPRGQYDRGGHEKILIDLAASQSQYFHYDAKCLNIWHQFDLAQHVGYGEYIAWPIFELDTFNEVERHHLGYPNKLVVCSEWAKGILLSNEISCEKDIFVVPLGIDTSIFKAKDPEPKSTTVFLNAGKWEIRKGHDILLSIFEEAFTVEDDVELWLMPFNIFLAESDRKNWEDMYLDSDMGRAGKIKILPWQATQRDVANIMAEADCGVFPSRAEGWNLEALEMMAMGRHVITTKCSAHTQFCDDKNSSLIDVNEHAELAYDGHWFFEQGNWAEIDEESQGQFSEEMRRFHERKQNGEYLRNDAGIETARSLTWDHTVDCLEKILLDK